MNILEKLQREHLKKDLPDFQVGDTVRVHTKIKEGDKERIQIFEGVIIRHQGHAREATFTVRKISYGVGVERIFPVHSPILDKMEVMSRGKVRRARLYYLRGLSGKKARLEGQETYYGDERIPTEIQPSIAAASSEVPTNLEKSRASKKKSKTIPPKAVAKAENSLAKASHA